MVVGLNWNNKSDPRRNLKEGSEAASPRKTQIVPQAGNIATRPGKEAKIWQQKW